MSRKLTLPVSYLKSYLIDLQRWLSEWRIAVDVSKSNATLFARAGRRFILPRPLTLFEEPIQWVDNSLSGSDHRYPAHLAASLRSGQEENCTNDGYAGPLFEQEKRSLHQDRIQAAHPPHYGLCVPRMKVCCPHARPEAACVTIQVSSRCYGYPLVSQ